MKKLYEENSIDIWKKIADEVQNLTFFEHSNKEFYNNLKKLQSILRSLNIDAESHNKYPIHEKEIGAASLLQSVYDSKRNPNYVKSNFSNIIYSLEEIGIKKIEFRPVDFYQTVSGINVMINNKNIPYLAYKVFTDGQFEIEIKDQFQDDNFYNMTHLSGEHFIIKVSLYRAGALTIPHNEISVSTAILNDFKYDCSVLPSEEEMLSMELPKILVKSKVMNWGESNENLIQTYERFERAKSNLDDKLISISSY